MEVDPTPGVLPATSSSSASASSNSHHNQRLPSEGFKSNLLPDITTNIDEEFAPSPMNFDYLQGLHDSSGGGGGGGGGGGAPPNSARSTMSAFSDSSATTTTTRHYDSGMHGSCGGGGGGGGSGQQIVDDSRVIDRPFDINERFVSVLDHLDAHVEKFRKDALGLQEKRDYLLMSIDLIKSNDLLHNMSDPEREEIHTYIQRVNARLGTVELTVRTVRDTSQEDSLSQINALIDMMITLGDPVLSRQRCQQYLNACCSSAEAASNIGEHFTEVDVFVQESSSSSSGIGGIGGIGGSNMETDIGPVDKKFESVLLGCTLDDQKNIKKRLQALMDYLNKQTVSH